jgi:hypothetical protein
MAGQSPLSLMHGERQDMVRRATPRAAARRRLRLWPIVLPVAVVVLLVLLAAGWCGAWYYAASVSARTLQGWVARETSAGRHYTCASQDISGFPFRIEAHCRAADVTLVSAAGAPVALAAKEIVFTAQVYHPTLLTGEVTAPLTVSAPGEPPKLVANWTLAQISVSGLPPYPDALSIAVAQPHLDDGLGAGARTLFAADDASFQARIVSGSAADQPVIDTVLHFTSATAPTVHPLLGQALQGDIEIVLSGFKDLSPKPLADYFREMHSAGGSIDIKSFRIERADAIVVGSGSLTVNERGRLDGVLNIAIAGMDSIVPLLGIDKLIGRGINDLTGNNGSPAQGLSALDRLLPGLSGVVRNTANASVADDLKKMGQPTEIDHKPATALPLRFADGSVYLGMIRVGEVPPLF